MGYGLSGGSGFLGHFFGADDKKEKINATQTDISNSNAHIPSSSDNALDLSLECRKAANVEKPECVQWFDDLSKSKASVSENGVATVVYDPSKPYEFKHIPQVQPTDFPRMSGVVTLSSGKLMAVDQQGNYMESVSQNDCKKWLSGYRPFNYFSQSQNQQTERSAPEQQVSNPENSL